MKTGAAARFMKLSRRQKLMFAEAMMLVMYWKFLLLIIPFRRLCRMSAGEYDNAVTDDKVVPSEIRDALRRTDRFSLRRSRCLAKSLAGRSMLAKRKMGSRIYLGVRFDNGGRLMAHAWLKTGEFEVVEKRGDYQELYVF